MFTKSQIAKIKNDPTIIPDLILELHKICIEEAERFDPKLICLKAALCRVTALQLEHIAGNIKKRTQEIAKEYF